MSSTETRENKSSKSVRYNVVIELTRNEIKELMDKQDEKMSNCSSIESAYREAQSKYFVYKFFYDRIIAEVVDDKNKPHKGKFINKSLEFDNSGNLTQGQKVLSRVLFVASLLSLGYIAIKVLFKLLNYFISTFAN